MRSILPSLAMATSPGFAALDWVALLGYAALLLVSGLWLSRRKQNDSSDYFLAGRSIPAWAAAVSLLATSMSAVTFIGGPELAFKSNLTYLSGFIGMVIAIFIVAAVFVPAFYRNNVTSIYELLGARFGDKARAMASWTFMIGRVFASGSRVFAGALPASLILFGDLESHHVLIAIAALSVVGVAYTIAGGIRSVIWTDVIQAIVFVGAAVVALVALVDHVPASLGVIIEALRHPGEGEPSKLSVFTLGLDDASPLGIDLSQYYTLITAFTGLVLFNMAAFGTDQDLVQRSLTCRNAAAGARSAVGGVLLGIPVTIVFMAVGLMLYIFYRRPDIMGSLAPAYETGSGQKIFLTYILHEMPAGLKGLMMAGLFAAGVSSLNSALNAMSSTLITDVYRRFAPDRDERHYVRVGRIAVAGWGVALGLFAGICVFWQRSVEQPLINFALQVMTFAYSGLLAVFLTAILTKRRGNSLSVGAALLTGFGVTLLLQPWPWAPWSMENSIAFPWSMLIATGLALLVCCAGADRRR